MEMTSLDPYFFRSLLSRGNYAAQGSSFCLQKQKQMGLYSPISCAFELTDCGFLSLACSQSFL